MAARNHRQLFPDMDDETAFLSLQLQLEDYRQLAASLRGNSRAETDAEFALRVAREELQRNVVLLQDRRIAAAVNRGVGINVNRRQEAERAARTVEVIARVEYTLVQQASNHNDLATEEDEAPGPLPEDQPIVPEVSVENRPEQLLVDEPAAEGQILQETPNEPGLESEPAAPSPQPTSQKLVFSYELSSTDNEEESAATQVEEQLEVAPNNIPLPDSSESENEGYSGDKQSSGDDESVSQDIYDTLSSRLEEEEEAKTHDDEESANDCTDLSQKECIGCWDLFLDADVVTLPCKHHLCRDCLQWRFTRALKDESCFPPECCEPISLESVLHLLPPMMEYQYRWKKVELTTEDRTYCSNVQCGQFLFPGEIDRKWEYCLDCDMKTCTMCKKSYHYGKTPDECGEDFGTLEVKALGIQEGWQQCPGCKEMVQLSSGCFHITCRCKAQFCYLCRARWKTCLCPQADEGSLEARPERIPVLRRGIPPALRPGNAQLEKDRLWKLQQTCEHQYWGTEMDDHSYECEICFQRLDFIKRCIVCGWQLCLRCLAAKNRTEWPLPEEPVQW